MKLQGQRDDDFDDELYDYLDEAEHLGMIWQQRCRGGERRSGWCDPNGGGGVGAETSQEGGKGEPSRPPRQPPPRALQHRRARRRSVL